MPTFDATDFDNAVGESGVVHQSTTNTDHNDASNLKQGYDYANFSEITPTPVLCYPLHEDSGTTANDLAGTNDGAYNGVTLGQTGLLGTTAPSWDGTDDYLAQPQASLPLPSTISFSFWVYLNGIESRDSFYGIYDGTYAVDFELESDGSINFTSYDGSNQHGLNPSTVTVPTGAWTYITAIYDGSNYVVDKNAGGATDSVTDSWYGDSVSGYDPYIGAHNQTGDDGRSVINGKLADFRIYDTALSGSDRQTLYDAVATQGTLTTQFKAV